VLFPRSINSSSNPTPRSLQYWQRVRRQRSRNWRVAEVAALLLPNRLMGAVRWTDHDGCGPLADALGPTGPLHS
jgi:hypothetical protein